MHLGQILRAILVEPVYPVIPAPTGTADHPANSITVGMDKDIVRHRLGQPTNRMTGADLLAKFASVADTDGGRQIAAIRTREYWLYENTPPGADTQIVIGPDKHVEDVAVRPHRGAGAN